MYCSGPRQGSNAFEPLRPADFLGPASGRFGRMVLGMSASIRPSVPAPRASLVHRKSLIGFRDACEQIWGAASLAKILETLPPDVRERTGGSRPLEPWHDLGDLV